MIEPGQNVDPAEIDKFEKMAARWWDPDSEFKPLHEINPLRLEFINKRTSLAGKKAIDVGCGGGLLSEGLARLGANTVGIDMGEAPLNVARLHQYESGTEVDYHQSTAEAFALENSSSFDVCTCLEMLEHVPDPASVIQACADLTKPGGQIFFSTINRNPKSYLLAVIGAEYLLGMLPKGTHNYQKFIKPSELDRWARTAGLVLQEIKGMSYNPLTREYSLGHDVDVNYLCWYQKPE